MKSILKKLALAGIFILLPTLRAFHIVTYSWWLIFTPHIIAVILLVVLLVLIAMSPPIEDEDY